MDAFFASVEQRDNPELRGKPVAVGGSEKRGVVAAASYEARKFGVRSAMPSRIAKMKCPELIFAHPRFDAYKEASSAVMAIMREYTDLVEPMSLDEAYLDVTTNKMNIKSATIIASEIRERIFKVTCLTASAGISINKFLAKVASDYRKPNGQFLISPKDAYGFITKLPVGKIPYVGKVTEERMKKLNIFSGGCLQKFTRAELVKIFGKTGNYYYDIVNNEYDSSVMPEHTRKSIGAERTFYDDISSENEMLEALEKICGILIKRMKKANVKGRTITIKIKFFNFDEKSRSKTFNSFINPETELLGISKELFYTPAPPTDPVRLLGIQVSTLNNTEESIDKGQLTIEF